MRSSGRTLSRARVGALTQTETRPVTVPSRGRRASRSTTRARFGPFPSCTTTVTPTCVVSRKEHLNGDYDDIAYNYLVCRHGYIYIGRGYQYQSAANRDGNSTYYAICGLTGILDGPVLLPGTTPPLVSALRRVIAHREALGGIACDIVGHGDIPGRDPWGPGHLGPYREHGCFQPASTTAETDPGPGADIR